jgi:hypothetical protein
MVNGRRTPEGYEASVGRHDRAVGILIDINRASPAGADKRRRIRLHVADKYVLTIIGVVCYQVGRGTAKRYEATICADGLWLSQITRGPIRTAVARKISGHEFRYA